ncbi:MAG: ABC transporter substrate-binding protein, partial [Thermomicrobiales bacterium]|nr:ABC transporter substrate-binding protein [Thermomicrobiales bacterium]
MPWSIGDSSIVVDRRCLLAVGSGALVALAVGRSTALAQTATPAGSWSFTDDLDVVIERPTRPERIVAYLPLAAGLWNFGIRPIAVYGTTRRPDGSPEGMAGVVDLDAVVSPGEAYGELDLERLVAL